MSTEEKKQLLSDSQEFTEKEELERFPELTWKQIRDANDEIRSIVQKYLEEKNYGPRLSVILNVAGCSSDEDNITGGIAILFGQEWQHNGVPTKTTAQALANMVDELGSDFPIMPYLMAIKISRMMTQGLGDCNCESCKKKRENEADSSTNDRENA